jgi:hypothetical protein
VDLLGRAGHFAKLIQVDNEPAFAKRFGILTAAKHAFEMLETSNRLRQAWLAYSRTLPESAFIPYGSMWHFWKLVKTQEKARGAHLHQACKHCPARVIIAPWDLHKQNIRTLSPGH